MHYNRLIPITAILWCFAVIIDQYLGSLLGLGFIVEGWALMTVVTAFLFIFLFSIQLFKDPKLKSKLFIFLGVLSLLDLISGIFIDDRLIISSIATSTIFLLLAIQGFFTEIKERLYLRLSIQVIVYTISNIILIFYFISPLDIYSYPGFESISWTTAIGFLIYSSTTLSTYHKALLDNSNLPEDISFINNDKVGLWFAISFYMPVLIILGISTLYFSGHIPANSGLAIALSIVCFLPFPMTFLIYQETIDWSVRVYEKNKKIYDRDKDIQYHNDLLHEFAQITSHNLRGPIVSLKNLTDLISSDDIPEERKEQGMQLFQEKMPIIAQTVDSLADFYNMIRTGEIKYATCDIKNLFLDAVTYCKLDLDVNSKIPVEFNLSATSVEYPVIYFENLTHNLISNSIKYCDKSRELKISVTTRNLASGCVEIIYRDNGLGMNLKYFKEKIFKFGSTYHNFESSRGMGLFIVKNQLARLGDTIEVNSVEGQYTEFIIKLNYHGKKELGYS